MAKRPAFRVKPPHPGIEPKYFHSFVGANNGAIKMVDNLPDWVADRAVEIQLREDPETRDWETRYVARDHEGYVSIDEVVPEP